MKVFLNFVESTTYTLKSGLQNSKDRKSFLLTNQKATLQNLIQSQIRNEARPACKA